MKKIVSISLLAALGSLLQADMSQQEFLYKDPRVMGMGSANTAVGGYSTAIFYNPAGLINIKRSHGVEVELLGTSLSASKGIMDFVTDLGDAQTDEEVSDVIKQYSGDTFSFSGANYSSVSYHTQSDIAFSIGILASVDSVFIPHANGGNDGLLEIHSRGYGGVTGGVAKRYENVFGLGGKLTAGVGLKIIMQKSYEIAMDAADLLEHQDDLATYLQDNVEVTNTGFGVDLGAIYELPYLTSWHPSVGVSVMNIGTLNFDDTYGAQPMTVNLGASVSPEVPVIESLVIAVDYVDLFNAQQARIRAYNSENEADYYDNADIEYDFLQHFRMGVNAGLVDNSWFMLNLMVGLYQGSYTAGLDMQLALAKLQLATYQEQMGSVTGQLEDRRYVVGLGIGW